MKAHNIVTRVALLLMFASAVQAQTWTTTTAAGDTVRLIKATQGIKVPFTKYNDNSVQTKAVDTTSTLATATETGFLGYADFNTFNDKVSRTDANQVRLTNTSNDVFGDSADFSTVKATTQMEAPAATFDVNGIAINAANYLGWSTDLFLFREAANVLAQYNSTSPQGFRLYNTRTNSTNYERGFARWNSNSFEIGTGFLGTGSSRPIKFVTNSATQWEISEGSGVLRAGTDNSQQIGSNDGRRPSSLFVRTSLNVQNSANSFKFTADTVKTYAFALRVGLDNTATYAIVDSIKAFLPDTVRMYIGGKSFKFVAE